MNFHEIRFPAAISFGSSGGPERRTEIVTLGSGHEERNTRWADSRRRYNAGLGIKTLNDLHEVISFFEQRRGRLYGFRWKDHTDHRSSAPLSTISSSDQLIGEGDGMATTFQLSKTYGEASSAYSRTISKPVQNSVMISVNDVQQIEDTDFTIDYQTGGITFEPSSMPPAEALIKAGFEFDVPVRFDTDQLKINLASFNAGEIPDIPLVEVRL